LLKEVFTLTPTLSLREREKGKSALDLSLRERGKSKFALDPSPLPWGEG